MLIVFSPIIFPFWFMLEGHKSWDSFWYYWKSVFTKDLNLLEFSESQFRKN